MKPIANSLMRMVLCGAAVAWHTVAAPDERTEPALRELAARIEAAIAAARDTPGREFANRLGGTEPYPAWLKYMKGQGALPSYPGLEDAVRDISQLVKQAEAGPTWPAPGVFSIPFTKHPPVVDGRLDDPAWATAAAWDGVYPFNETENTGPATAWRMLWNHDHLYVAFDCRDDDVTARDRDRDGPVYEDDCVELFILPDLRFRTYWEIVISPGGSVFDAVQCKHPDRWGFSADPAQNMEGLRFAQVVRGTLNRSDDTDEGYSVEVAVPFSQMPGFTRRPPRAGDRLHFMLARLDRRRGALSAYAFRPLQAWGHNIWNHAVMELNF